MTTCYQCANIGEFSNMLCEDCCSTLKDVSCKYHTWFVCKKHKNMKCGECKANKNYAMKYG